MRAVSDAKEGNVMQIGKMRIVRSALYGVALAGLLLAIILPTVAAKDNQQFRVRVFMAAVDSGVDVWIDDVQLTNNARFKSLTAYSSRPEGNYALKIYPAGKKSSTLVNTSFRFAAPKDYTIIVYGKQADSSINTQVEIDRNTLDGSNNTSVRLGNYIASAGTLTLATAGTNVILGNARYGETDEYVSIASGTYSLILNDSNSKLVAKLDNVALGPNTTVSVFAIGLNTDTPAPTLLVNTDAGTAPAQATATATAPATAPSPSAPAPSPISASAALRQAFQPVPSIATTGTKVFYTATGHTLGGVFKTYWEQHGGLEQFGYPITEEYQEVSLTDGKTYTTQYFERAFRAAPRKQGHAVRSPPGTPRPRDVQTPRRRITLFLTHLPLAREASGVAGRRGEIVATFLRKMSWRRRRSRRCGALHSGNQQV